MLKIFMIDACYCLPGDLSFTQTDDKQAMKSLLMLSYCNNYSSLVTERVVILFPEMYSLWPNTCYHGMNFF